MNPEFVLDFANKHLGEYGKDYYIKNNKLHLVYCPICHGGHSGDKHTFAIHLRTGGFVCMRGNCGVKGNLEELAKMMGVAYDGSPSGNFNNIFVSGKKKTYNIPDVKLNEPTQGIIDYFSRRKITEDTVRKFEIASDDAGNIIFPFYRDKKLVYVKYRKPRKPLDGEKKEWQAPGTEPILFGMQLCDPTKPLIITEGQIDAMSVYEAGVANVVSVPCGVDNVDWIENCWDWLELFDKIILFGDNDIPGKRMIENLTKRLDPSRCWLVEDYPNKPDGTPCKDANEVIFFVGKQAIMEMILNASPVPIRGLVDLGDVEPIDPTQIPRIKTYIPMLDELLGGLLDGAITVITGRPGSGKSTIGGQLLLGAIQQGHNVCAYSGEMSKERFQHWVNLQAAGSPYITLKHDDVKGKKVPFVPNNIQARIRDKYRGHFFLFDNNEIFEYNQAKAIIQVFTVAARRYGCKLFLVDNLMTAIADSVEETRAQGQFVAALKSFALKFGVHIIIVAHPRKTKANEALRQDDVGGNGDTTRLADNVITMEKPDINVIKSRDEGICKTIECCFCGDSRRIYQANVGDRFIFGWDKSGIDPVSVRADSMTDYGIRMSKDNAPKQPPF